MTKGFGRYTVATIAVIVVAGALLALLFRGPGDVMAIGISGALALAVQLLAFVLGRTAGTSNLTARMGIGAILRFLALIVYALLAAKVFMLPLVAALISLAAFFFLSTLIEPLLIK